LPDLEEGRVLLEYLIAENPSNPYWSSLSGFAWENTGAALEQSGRNREALEAYRRAADAQRSALRRVPQSGQYQSFLVHHLTSLARVQRALGQADEAIATTMMRRELTSRNPNQLYEMARELSAFIPQLREERSRPDDSHHNHMAAPRISELAIEMLRQALETGFRDVRKLRTEPAFRSIRSRGDFQNLVLDMAFPSNPFNP
jgi:tetratricopeptide (TPR) repeat protein